MKRVAALVMLLLAMAAVTTISAFAGPLLGIQLEPVVGAKAALVGGWDFGDTAVECSKTDFAYWSGNWSIAALWTPSHQTFSYRVGPKLLWDWKPSGALEYQGVALVLGVSKTWGAFQLFGELDLEATGVLKVKPLLGVNILFEQFFLQSVE